MLLMLHTASLSLNNDIASYTIWNTDLFDTNSNEPLSFLPHAYIHTGRWDRNLVYLQSKHPDIHPHSWKMNFNLTERFYCLIVNKVSFSFCQCINSNQWRLLFNFFLLSIFILSSFVLILIYIYEKIMYYYIYIPCIYIRPGHPFPQL